MSYLCHQEHPGKEILHSATQYGVRLCRKYASDPLLVEVHYLQYNC